jgi:hypothetical protein
MPQALTRNNSHNRQLMENIHAQPLLTLDEIILQLSYFTAEQRSLAWSPEPPFVSGGAGDCRPGGNGGLCFNNETPRARWVQARYRWNREQERNR